MASRDNSLNFNAKKGDVSRLRTTHVHGPPCRCSFMHIKGVSLTCIEKIFNFTAVEM